MRRLLFQELTPIDDDVERGPTVASSREVVRTYRRESPPNDELREFACAEGLSRERLEHRKSW